VKIIGCVMTMFLSFMIPLGARTPATPSSFNSPFDEYGAICWDEEKARLDNFAIQLLNDDGVLGQIIVYDGKRACRGEAVTRASRARKYLVDYRRVPADRIVWRWGGYLPDMMTTLVIHSSGASMWPFRQSLSLAEVTFAGNCNRNVRPVKCHKW
jgi:hypothetical protein